MIYCFPEAYPDELFYSIYARYCERMRYRMKRAAISDLMEGRKYISIILPNIFQLSRQLPIYSKQYILQMLTDHTMFPYYYPFFEKYRYEKVKKVIFGDSNVENENNCWVRKLTSTPQNKRMRFCPICTREDQIIFGESYWHRIHQIFGVEVCPTHNIILLNSNVRFANYYGKVISAEKEIDKKNLKKCYQNHNKKLLNIAEDIEWILKQRGKIYFQESALKKFRTLCKNKGLALGTGKICSEQIVYLIKKYYSKNILERLQCGLENTRTSVWPMKLFVTDRTSSTNPLKYILFLHTFGYRMHEFAQLPIA